jgi:hypothetical protein
VISVADITNSPSSSAVAEAVLFTVAAFKAPPKVTVNLLTLTSLSLADNVHFISVLTVESFITVSCLETFSVLIVNLGVLIKTFAAWITPAISLHFNLASLFW